MLGDPAGLLAHLEGLANPANVAGMARFGIRPARALGISVNTLRGIARSVRQEVKEPRERHALAAALWESGIHEARILASLVDEPGLVEPPQMEAWAAAFDSWDLVDQVCGNLFDRCSYGYAKAIEWSARPEEFVRRAAFSLMAWIAVHDKKRPAADFEPFLDAILAQAGDERNFVKKAVNWALRSIGKRSPALNRRAIAVAGQMAALPARAARWNARDALIELTGERVQQKLRSKGLN